MKFITKLNESGKIAVDDNILVEGVLSTAGSHILDGFKPLFSAEAVTRLEKAGYTVSGKTNVGEFGLDLLGETSYYGAVTENGFLKGAAASLVADGTVEAALCVDVNGYPRRAAAASDVAFLKPTYSTVSRYGVIAAASSGEQIGVTAKGVEKIAEVMSVIAGHDAKDGTSDKAESYVYSTTEEVSGKKVCLIAELYDAVSSEVKTKIDSYIKKLEAKGVSVEKVSLPLVLEAKTVWQILLSAETCNNVSRFDGVKYGHRAEKYRNIDELYVNSRTEGFGFLTKATILYGSDVLSKGRYENCYDKAMRVRRIIAEELNKIFEKFDAVLLPVASQVNYSEYDLKDAFSKVFEESVFTALANLTGAPALVTGGVQLMAASFKESTLLSLAKSVEEDK